MNNKLSGFMKVLGIMALIIMLIVIASAIFKTEKASLLVRVCNSTEDIELYKCGNYKRGVCINPKLVIKVKGSGNKLLYTRLDSGVYEISVGTRNRTILINGRNNDVYEEFECRSLSYKPSPFNCEEDYMPPECVETTN